jgi:hypothetical protein
MHLHSFALIIYVSILLIYTNWLEIVSNIKLEGLLWVQIGYNKYFESTNKGIETLALRDNYTSNLGVLHRNMLGTIQTIRKSRTNSNIN